jgi:hypothetical protein
LRALCVRYAHARCMAAPAPCPASPAHCAIFACPLSCHMCLLSSLFTSLQRLFCMLRWLEFKFFQIFAHQNPGSGSACGSTLT